MGTDFQVIGSFEGAPAVSECSVSERLQTDPKKIMVMVATDQIGHGDDTLGSKLMAAFLKTLKEMGDELWRLVFLNNGVKLTIEGSQTLPTLKELEGDGISILVCGTCLDHYELLEKKQVGETTNMLDIVTSMHLADKVINI
jgi:selenium metabolism protein YedF